MPTTTENKPNMPAPENETAIPDLSTVSKLAAFLQASPPTTAEFQAFGRAILIHLRQREKMEAVMAAKVAAADTKIEGLKTAMRALVELISSDEKGEAPVEAAATPGAGTPTTATPSTFPAGVPWKADQAPAATAGADEEEGDLAPGEVPPPDTVARVVNMAPSAPKPPGAGNGIKPQAS